MPSERRFANVMSRRLTFAPLALAMALTSAARGQQSHVRTRYAKDIDLTMVDSDLLYVINMPSQFLAMG